MFDTRSAENTGLTRLPRAHWTGRFAVLAILTAVLPLHAQTPAGGALGTMDFPTSCRTDVAGDFNHAVALLHHMTYPQARAAFERIVEDDQECAMAHWGIAMTLFQPTWPTRPGPPELRRGWEAVQQALSIGPDTRREQMFVASVEAFFRDPTSSDYWERIRRWEKALEALHESFPTDPEAATFFALAHLATAPSDQAALDHANRSADLLLGVLAQNADHPGAMHYLVHANDAPGRETQHLEVTRRYEELAPDNPHALHMPTHIYTRLGAWDGVVRGNMRAAEAALAHPAGDRGELVSDEYPHAIEYLVYAHLQQGEDEAAAMWLERLLAADPLQPGFKTAFHIASTQARFALERRDWEAAARLVPRDPAFLDWDRLRWPEAVTWFARGMGSVKTNDPQAAQEAAERLVQLEAAASATGEELFARNIRVLRLELEAWQAHAAGDDVSSVALLREAGEVEQSTPKHAVTPGPTLPASELLGDLLLESGRPAEALAAFQRSLELYPGRFNSLLGAARAARASGDETLGRDLYSQLLEVAASSQRASLDEARKYAAEG